MLPSEFILTMKTLSGQVALKGNPSRTMSKDYWQWREHRRNFPTASTPHHHNAIPHTPQGPPQLAAHKFRSKSELTELPKVDTKTSTKEAWTKQALSPSKRWSHRGEFAPPQAAMRFLHHHTRFSRKYKTTAKCVDSKIRPRDHLLNREIVRK